MHSCPSILNSAQYALIFLFVGILTVATAEHTKQTTDIKCARVTQRVACGVMVCNETTSRCGPCTNDDQCDNPLLECDADTQRCAVRPIADSFSARTCMSAVIAFFVCALAVVAGIGGGGILVPLFIIVIGLPPSLAVALSQATIIGQSSLNTAVLVLRRHPLHPRPIIHYDALLMLLPMTLAGTTVGHILGAMIPDWLRILFLFVLLGYIFRRAVQKAQRQRAADARDASASKDVDEVEAEPSATEMSPQTSPSWGLQEMDRMSPKNEKRQPQYPKLQIALCLSLWLFLGIMSYLKASSSDIVHCGSGGFWSIVSVIVVVNSLVAVGLGQYLRHSQQVDLGSFRGMNRIEDTEQPENEQTQAAEPANLIPPGDVLWTQRNAIVFPALAIFAGLGAAVLGIGGGMVLSLLLLEMHLHPETVSATGSVATLFASAITGTQFAMNGELPYDYGAVFVVVGLASTLLGQFGMNAWIRRHKKSSYIIYALAVITFSSLVALGVVGIMQVVDTARNGGSFGFGKLCKE